MRTAILEVMVVAASVQAHDLHQHVQQRFKEHTTDEILDADQFKPEPLPVDHDFEVLDL